MGIVVIDGEVVGIGIGAGRGRGRRRGEGGEAEEGEEGKGDAADMAEREAEDEVQNMVAAETLGITGDVLAEIGRNIGDPQNERTVQHHG